jgi:hypothetical protein
MSYNDAPTQVQDGRAKKLAGDRLADLHRPRPFWCRGCGDQHYGLTIPRSWYSLMRSVGPTDLRPIRLGLYCSIRCLQSQMERLTRIEDNLGDAFDEVASPFHQRPTVRDEREAGKA